MCNRIAVVGVVLLLLSAAGIGAPRQDDTAGWRIGDIPGWTVGVYQDVFTDKYEAGLASAEGFGEGLTVLCSNTAADNPSFTSGLRVSVGKLPPLGVDSVEVEYRIREREPQTDSWRTTTGTGGSTVIVPDELVADVLRAGRLALRVQGHTQLLEWPNGEAIYELMSACAGRVLSP